MQESEVSVGRKIGNTQVRFDWALMVRLRDRVKLFPEKMRLSEKIAAIKAEFETLSSCSNKTLEEYVYVVATASDFMFEVLGQGKLSILQFNELCHGTMDRATRDTLTHAVVDKKITYGQIRVIKKTLKQSKGRCSLAEAIMKATGEIPLHSKSDHLQESQKTFTKAVNEVADYSLKFMTKIQMALDLVPSSAIQSGEIHLNDYERLTTFETTLESTLNFVRMRKKQWLEWLKSHLVTEATMKQLRQEGASEQVQGQGSSDPGQQG